MRSISPLAIQNALIMLALNYSNFREGERKANKNYSNENVNNIIISTSSPARHVPVFFFFTFVGGLALEAPAFSL